MKAAAVLIMFAALATAAPRKPLADYPLRASNADFDIGIEYTVHSYGQTSEGSAGQMYLARDFLVFEIAVFPKHPVQIPDGAFELTVNNAKRPIPQVQAEVVAMNVRDPEWTQHPHVEMSAGAGGAGVTVGRPQQVPHFPGDDSRQRLPNPPHAPESENTPKTAPLDPARLAVESAFTSGMQATPRSGNIYFPYSGNPARIKHLTLHLDAGAQSFEITVK